MVGRPRRRHAVDRNGRLYETTPIAPSMHKGQIVDERKGRNQRSLRQWLRPFFIGVSSLLLLLVLWAVIGSVITLNKVVDKNATKKAPILSFLGEIQPNQLNGEGDGRINVLLIGIGGAKHPGGNLADTIMVASLDPKRKEVALLSIPRDLYVPIEGNGNGKINTAHSYGEQHAKKTGGGPAVMKKTVSSILDLPIHYYIRVDFQALVKIVDALGGVTVDVEKPIVDLSYPADNMIDYAPFRLSAGVQKLDGKTALKYVRSRHASGSEGSDFARAKRQQKVLSALRGKALSAGVLANPKKITELIGILGNHIKTDLSLWEMERFVQVWKDIDDSKVFTKVLDNGANGPLISHSGDGRGYILLPRTGDFTEVQQIAHEIFIDPFLRDEEASIALINASGSSATGTQVVAMLKRYGYKVIDATPRQQAKAAKTTLTDHTGVKPYTKQFLETRFKIKASRDKDDETAYDLTLVIGADYVPPKVKNVKPPVRSTPTGATVSPASTPSAEPNAD